MGQKHSGNHAEGTGSSMTPLKSAVTSIVVYISEGLLIEYPQG